jgi:hypothetical protein
MSFFVPFIPYVGSAAAAVGTEVASLVGSSALGSAATAAVGAGIGYVADATLNKLVDTEKLKKEASKQLSLAQKIALLRSGKNTNTKEIIQSIKGTEALKGTSLDTVKDRSKLFVNEVSNELLEGKLINQAVENVSESSNSPLYDWLGISVLSGIDDAIVPTDPEYLYVSSVYDGSVFFNTVTKERFTNGSREFYAETERGEVSWFFPYYNNNPPYAVIPTIYGFWCGLNSINNALPISMEINGVMHMSLLDRISHVHDCLYRQYGIFSKFSDYVLISYISKGLEQGLFILPGERNKALIAINYFSSLGKLMRSLYGGSESIYDLSGNGNKIVEEDVVVEDNIDETTEVGKVGEMPVLLELSDDLGFVGSELTAAPVVSEVVSSIGSSQVSELVSLINNLNFENN